MSDSPKVMRFSIENSQGQREDFEVPLVGYCRNCKWWDHEPFGTGRRPPIKDGEYRKCFLLSRSADEFGKRFDPKGPEGEPDQLAYADVTEDADGIFTAPNFGCVQFEAEVVT